MTTPERAITTSFFVIVPPAGDHVRKVAISPSRPAEILGVANAAVAVLVSFRLFPLPSEQVEPVLSAIASSCSGVEIRVSAPPFVPLTAGSVSETNESAYSSETSRTF